MKKRTFWTEIAYLAGLAAIAAGVALMEKADFGVSMVVAPAYLLYLRLSESFSFFTFGMAEYVLQAVLIAVMSLILHRFKLSYLFSFITAVVYGFILDGFMALSSFIPGEILAVRIACYTVGMLACAVGVSLMFHTYIPPEAYELFVSEVSRGFNIKISVFKTAYDLTSCAIAVVMSFCFFGFGHFEGVKAGTVICALVNGYIIGQCTVFLEKHFDFTDRFRGYPSR